ncbi:MAG: sigma-70 family RNA polymerase sigma factor [Lachnospiraceae bacterium]|nr:sigma-70 family RNA polymerase sigma factor [Lachnospiraceae bacterium]
MSGANLSDMEEIYLRYATPLKKYAVSICHDPVLADDIVSETFYRAIKNIDSFKDGSLFAWLCTISKNIYFNYLKKKENKNVSLDDEDFPEYASGTNVEEEVIKRDERKKLNECIAKLSQIERDVVRLRTDSDLSFKEIGDVLHKSENWARVTFYRCKEKLKGMMQNEE